MKDRAAGSLLQLARTRVGLSQTAFALAARICSHAEPGQILVSAAVKELALGKSLGFVDLGPIALKGFDDPVRLYQAGSIR